MSEPYEFALLRLDSLHEHEQVVPSKVTDLANELRTSGVFVEPIWVARGSLVILNGHHRYAAMRRLGAERIPAWVMDYDDDSIRLERWMVGPPLTKAEVIRRGRTGELFTPQTTRHILSVKLPPRSTPLRELMPASGQPLGAAEFAPSPRDDASRARSSASR
jgi:L-serine kinase (ADP)